MKRKRELQQHRAELVGCAQHIKAGANLAFLRRSRAGRGRPDVVSESLPELRREYKTRIRRYAFDPLRRVVRAQRLVKRSVDLNRVKVFREIRRFVEPFGPARGVNVPGPIRIGPSRRPHAHNVGSP